MGSSSTIHCHKVVMPRSKQGGWRGAQGVAAPGKHFGGICCAVVYLTAVIKQEWESI